MIKKQGLLFLLMHNFCNKTYASMTQEKQK